MLSATEKEVEHNSRFSRGYRMIDSGRGSDLFRRHGVSAPLRCPGIAVVTLPYLDGKSLSRTMFPTAVNGLLSQGS
jgi:hypothetical protein